MFMPILVVLDREPHSETAIQVGVHLAKDCDAKILFYGSLPRCRAPGIDLHDSEVAARWDSFDGASDEVDCMLVVLEDRSADQVALCRATDLARALATELIFAHVVQPDLLPMVDVARANIVTDPVQRHPTRAAPLLASGTDRPKPPGVHMARGPECTSPEVALPRRVLLKFRVVANAVQSPRRGSRLHQGVGDKKLLALRAIAHYPGMGVNAVASALGIRQPTASQVVKALAASRLVTVRRDEGDRRAVRIHATVEGQAVVRGLPSSFGFGDRLPLALGLLRTGELLHLESGLAELLEALPTGPRMSGGEADRT